MACSSCAAKAAYRQGRYLSSSRTVSTPQEEPTLLCDYTKEELEVKLSEVYGLLETTTQSSKRKKLFLQIAVLKSAIRYYEDNCLKYTFQLDEIFGKEL